MKTKACNLEMTWLEVRSRLALADAAFVGEHALTDLFTKHNSPDPFSAGVESFLSKVKHILTAMTASLSDGNFERLMLIKGKQHYIQETEKTQTE